MQDEEGYAVLRLQSKKKEFSQLPPDSHRPPQWQGTPLKVAFTVIVILQVVMLVLICLEQRNFPGSMEALGEDFELGTELKRCSPFTESREDGSGFRDPKTADLFLFPVAFGQQVCPEGWKLHRQKCYFFYNLTIKRTWNESKTICSEKKSHLAVIRDTCDMVRDEA
ncbi:killer cell lectin-like receptor subfamily F member 1 [Ornithorhynchus anatinus]|uniref:killer cell lectin-like receptor subfamily F member 1 n=1 Tax=Ornithorhynchus anatinus TaxID=9258 RepID=UPI0019D4CB04|nr:killer cell lectin-like receptor subfamily F member 1 [Ornithorhynchus anatinus]